MFVARQGGVDAGPPERDGAAGVRAVAVAGRALHSFTFELNLSASCGIGGAFSGCLGGD